MDYDSDQPVQDIVVQARLADYSPVKGCMVIRPNGYSIWERIQGELNRRIKEKGVRNAYFPMLIPESFMKKEAEHVEGFAPECAVVTYAGAKDLEENLVLRPTSETMINTMFTKWIQSYRDLPLLINQWANVMRWEMRTRLFLRTAEFLWQEGHTAHETKEEAIEETRLMHGIYTDFITNHLAIPVVAGEKSEVERFPGAEMTLTVEAMVQDKKAIQAGTSHFLGQNFSKAQDISFTGRDNTQQHAWTTSWGVSTRLIGTLIMAHSDDDGLICPPRIASQQVIIIPVTPKEDSRDAIIDACEALATTLRHKDFHGEPLRVQVDKRDLAGGAKKWEWVKKGAPIRIEIGPRDLENRKVCMQRRDEDAFEKHFMDKEEFIRDCEDTLQEIQNEILRRATELRDSNISECSDLTEFEKHFTDPKNDQPGWLITPWAGSNEEEETLSKKHKISIRCFPLDKQDGEEAPCLITGKPTKARAIWGRSY